MTSKKDAELGCGSLVLLFFALSFLVGDRFDSSSSRSSSSPDLSSHPEIDLWVDAKMEVTSRLKSPSSADFGSVLGNYQDPEKCVRRLGDGWVASGWVDADNSFGAKIRSSWTVTFDSDGKVTSCTIK